MNAVLVLTGVLSCLFLMLTIASSFTLAGKGTDGEHHLLIEPSVALLSGKYPSSYQDDDAIVDNWDDENEHELEKRRFNAWAGKRSLLAKRRFNAWAGRR